MTNCQTIRPHLSQFVDDALDAETRAAVDAHLSTCAACAGIVDDLSRLRSAARRLGPIDPPERLWLNIESQVRQERSRPNEAVTPASNIGAVWQWIGLAAALVIVTLGVYAVQHRNPPAAPAVASNAQPTSGNAGATGSVETVAQELQQAEEHYDKAIAELEALTRNSDASMDPDVARTLEKNLATIDEAISESRAALEAHPESEPARDSLFEALRKKVGVLQATVMLMNEMRNGNQDGAARAAAGIGRGSGN
jgi:anti-sigma factor RsiW